MKDKELPITGFEPKGNQFGLRDIPEIPEEIGKQIEDLMKRIGRHIADAVLGDGRKYPHYSSLEADPLTSESFRELINELRNKYSQLANPPY